MSNDFNEVLSWIVVDPRVISRGASSSPECLSLSVRLWLEVGATNMRLKLLHYSQVLLKMWCRTQSASAKIYVEEGFNLGRISSENVIKSSWVDSNRIGVHRGWQVDQTSPKMISKSPMVNHKLETGCHQTYDQK